MYDEFGNLKKKFRAKTQQAEMALGIPGVGRAGWEVEELGIIMDFVVPCGSLLLTFTTLLYGTEYAVCTMHDQV